MSEPVPTPGAPAASDEFPRHGETAARVEAEFAHARVQEGNATLESLVRSIAAGDHAALARLYDTTVNRILGAATRFMGDTASAEDVALEVYVQAWRSAARYDASRSSVYTWLLMICRSRALDALRARGARPPEAGFEPLEPEGPVALNTLQEVEHRESCVALLQALATLAPGERQLVALAFYRGLTHSEMALHAGMPLGTVKATLRRALRKLREAMEAAEGGRG